MRQLEWHFQGKSCRQEPVNNIREAKKLRQLRMNACGGRMLGTMFYERASLYSAAHLCGLVFSSVSTVSARS